jgi:CPA1 family monovalent cation:H+ antiporter
MATALLVRYIAIPYTVALVSVGLLLALLGVHSSIHLDRDLIVDGFLPLLLFEATLPVDFRALRQALPGIVVLAVPGVILSTLIVGALLHRAIGVPLAAAALFGALISATDPVAVLALFRELRLPRPLTMLVEGESVLNDGTALVLFSLLLPAAAGGAFSLASVGIQFVYVVVAGLVIGAACGAVGSAAVSLTDDHLVELGLTVLLAYGSFLVAQALAVSGVVACVTAGLVFTSRSERALSSTAQELLRDVWEFAAFLANSLLFLLIGLLVSIPDLARSAPAVGWAILAAVLARVVVVYGLSVPLQFARRPLLAAHRHLVFWSGLRGALAIALVLSLPGTFPLRDLFLRLTLGVVLFTLLVQGLTIRPLMRIVLRPSEGAGPASGQV